VKVELTLDMFEVMIASSYSLRYFDQVNDLLDRVLFTFFCGKLTPSETLVATDPVLTQLPLADQLFVKFKSFTDR
jgi:hypothetical protein